ncbi:MAG: putative 3-mercaptopyruvate sulfurtransferase [Rhodothermaceae bacterium]|nr:MAG: putative 3-mercaptopyruvate sulfurtransferase [Rhodothermaceae bacterium]
MVDCRFSLQDPERGRRAYREAHIPGAVYAHLDDDLSGPVVPGRTGRHPWPDPDALAATLSAFGIDETVQVVAYDDAGGAIAARLWGLLTWLGHDAVAVLDGGWPAWQRAGYPVRGGEERRPPRRFVPRPRPGLLVTAGDVERVRQDPAWRLLDARAPERFRGEHEPIDPVAGHIPGAVSAPFAGNLDDGGRFLPPETLRARYATLLGEVPPERVVCYCGSGVTANHVRLAMAHAGLGLPRLYPGSWSEWITDPARPVAREAPP